MKTRLLLLLLMLLCIPGLKAETILRLTLTDVPEGLDLKELTPEIRNSPEEWEMPHLMSYDESTNSYVLSSEYIPDWEYKTEVALIITGKDLIPPTPVIWKIIPGQKELHLEYSLKEFRKYTLSPEADWTFLEKKDEQTVFMPLLIFGNTYEEGNTIWGYSGNNQIVAINEAEYHVYTRPGSYIWRGTLYKSDGSKTVMTFEEPVTFDSENTNVTLTADWPNRTEVTTKITGIEEDPSQYILTYSQKENSWINTSINTTVLLHRGENYQWNLDSYYEKKFIVAPKSGSFTPSGNQDELIIDFSDYTRTQIDLIQDLESITTTKDIFLNIHGNLSQSIYNAPTSLPVYLPKNQTYTLEYSYQLENKESQMYRTFPLWMELTTDQDKQISIRTSDFHKVSFIYDNQPIYSEISLQEYPNGKMNGTEIYMPDGNYHAVARHPVTGINMPCDFTINGEDRIIDYETMAKDFKTIVISLKNTDLIPSDIEAPYANFSITKGEYEVTFDLPIDLKEGSGTVFLPKDTFTYLMKLESADNQIITQYISGSFKVTDDLQEVVFDLDTLCIVPLKVKDESGNLLPAFYTTMSGIYWFMQKPKSPSYLMLAPSMWRLNVFAAGYEPAAKRILIQETTPEININLKKAEIFPVFIIPEDLKDWETAEIQVEGVGSYSYSKNTGFSGNMLPFMEVAAGTYNVSVSADGYETVQGQIVVDRSMCPEGSSEIIYKISMENGFTGVQQADAVETLDIRGEGKQIVIDSETDCRAQIYTLSGVCVAHLQGKSMRSEALAPGIYLVLARNAQGTISRKIIIGH